MSVSADLLRLAIVRETTPGVTPATPAYQLLRATSESIAYQPETQLSNELNPARQVTDVIVTGGQSSGDIAFELSSNPGFELLLEGALGNLWDGDQLWVGALLLTHTVEKRFTLDPNAPVPEDQYEFNRVARSLIDALSLTFSPGGPATGSATLLAGLLAREDAEIAGSTYVTAGTLPVMVGAQVIPITFSIEGTDYTTWCVSNLVVNFRNNGRAIACLGQEAANEVVLGRFECEITADVYINAETKTLMDAFLDRTEMAFAFTASDSLGNAYEFSFPRVRVSGATEVAAGTNQDVIMNITMQALVDVVPALGTVPADADTCVLIERTHITAPWPEGVARFNPTGAPRGATPDGIGRAFDPSAEPRGPIIESRPQPEVVPA